MRVVLANAFSLSMLRGDTTLKIEKIDTEEVKKLIKQNESNFLSIIGHESTAKIMSSLFGVEVKPNRTSYTLEKDDILIVFQILVRLGEGQLLSQSELQQLLSEGKVTFYKVQLVNN